ncbi:MAG: 50S ribosomal protein L10 [Burkholderiaceae bacterium]|nr:50S ribosomal protein L10 [Pseudomonadota bacterium]MDA0846983.1 50S ribosomal protein L10 [Pseudomonadota bacterium]MDP4577493.1 50S ribosomal protein L10 [Burkholderiaceae bacterium]MDP4669158.1 50S ribosomal protein L10 [Burkholderiaceae bacterium]MDP4800544.1 50S ribosomal protein L10 [Burkholderiaceae bacterium]
MALNREAKASMIADVSAQLAKAQAVIVAEYRGLDVSSMTELRRKARQSGVYLRVLKNTLVRRAIAGTPFEKLSDQMVGPLIYGVSQDPVAVAKVLQDFAKANERLVIRAGALPNSIIDANAIKALAALPSREELLAKLLGTMQAPTVKFVQTLNEVPTSFVRALAAVRDQREQANA